MKWTMGRLMDLATGYWKSAVLSAAVELDVFALLEPDGATAEAVATARDASPRHMEELLNALAGLGLLAKENGRFRLHPDAAHLLSSTSPSCLTGALRYNADLYPLWGRLASCVKEGAPRLPPVAHLGQDPERTRRFVLGMHSRATAFAPDMLAAFDLAGVDTLLDVASGPGTFTRAMAESNPGLRVTLFDLPPVLDVARELTARSPAANRIEFQPGDYRRDPIRGLYDAAFYCGAIHQESPETAKEVLRKTAAALKPGGRLWVVDFMLDDTRTEPVFSILFSLNMLLTSPIGRVQENRYVETLLRDAELVDVTTRRPDRLPYWIVEGRRG